MSFWHGWKDHHIQIIHIRHLWSLRFPIPFIVHAIIWNGVEECLIGVWTRIVTLYNYTVVRIRTINTCQSFQSGKYNFHKKFCSKNFGLSLVPHSEPVTVVSIMYGSPFLHTIGPLYLSLPWASLVASRTVFFAILAACMRQKATLIPVPPCSMFFWRRNQSLPLP